MLPSRRKIVQATLAAGLSIPGYSRSAPGSAAASGSTTGSTTGSTLESTSWPSSRPIRFVVPFAAGGANDLMGRAAAEGVSKLLGHPVIVENHPGAGSLIGADLVARSAPDGHTFLVSAAGVISHPLIRKTMPYQEGDLVPVALIGLSPSVIIVRADAPWANLRAFIEASRTGPGFHFATAGVGSTPHFVAVILNTYYGAQLEPVAYKSGSESATAIASGQVQASSEASIVSQGYLQAGRFRGLATTWVRRLAAFPQLPTALEQGYPELQIAHWAGLHAPRGTPAEILDRIAQAVDVAMNSTATAQKLTRLGIEPGAGSRQSFEHFVQQERERLGAVVRRTRMSEQ